MPSRRIVWLDHSCTLGHMHASDRLGPSVSRQSSPRSFFQKLPRSPPPRSPEVITNYPRAHIKIGAFNQPDLLSLNGPGIFYNTHTTAYARHRRRGESNFRIEMFANIRVGQHGEFGGLPAELTVLAKRTVSPETGKFRSAGVPAYREFW
jgi:hypothetical protein